MANTFYWHDYETFGVDPAKDRPSQFAGLRTDEELNPIGDPLVIYCQPQRDILPSAQACLITGITPQLAMEKGIPEPEFIHAIHRELSLCGKTPVSDLITIGVEFTMSVPWLDSAFSIRYPIALPPPPPDIFS